MPRLIKEGFDVTLANWRGIVGPPEISCADATGSSRR